MVNQQEIPFVIGSETSEAAADSVRDSAPALEARVLDYFLRVGRTGVTDEELDEAMGTTATRGSRPRRVRLVEKMLVVASGRKRETYSGRKAVVWVANIPLCEER